MRSQPAQEPSAIGGLYWPTAVAWLDRPIEPLSLLGIARARRRGLTGVRVFGSMSRGDGSDDSDVDLLVTLAPGSSALALGGLLMDAQELLGRRVDVVTESSLHPALRDRVVASAAPL